MRTHCFSHGGMIYEPFPFKGMRTHCFTYGDMCCNWLIAARASSYVDLTSFICVRAGNFYSLVYVFGSKTQPFSSCLYTRVSSFLRWSSCFASGVDYNKLPGLGRPPQSCLCTSALVLLRFFHFPLGRFPSI